MANLQLSPVFYCSLFWLPQFEAWKPVVTPKIDYTGIYEVSNYGRVKSVSRIITLKSGKGKIHTGKILSTSSDSDGYRQIVLIKSSSQHCYKVHRLVGFAFLCNPQNLPEINHIHPRKDLNRADNLEWASSLQNKKHSIKLGLWKPGEIGNHKLTTIQATELKFSGLNSTEAGKKYNISRSGAWKILTGRTWSNIIKPIQP